MTATPTFILEDSESRIRISRPWIQAARSSGSHTLPTVAMAQVAVAAFAVLTVAMAIEEYRDGDMFFFWFAIGLAALLVVMDIVLVVPMIWGRIVDEIDERGIRQRAQVLGLTWTIARWPWKAIASLELDPGVCIRYAAVTGTGWIGSELPQEVLAAVYRRMVAWHHAAGEASA